MEDFFEQQDPDKPKVDDPWKEWEGMPEFNNQDLRPYNSIIISFDTEEDVLKFEELLGYEVPRSKINKPRRTLWFPKKEGLKMADKRYATDES